MSGRFVRHEEVARNSPATMTDAQLEAAWVRLATEHADCPAGTPRRQVVQRVIDAVLDEKVRREGLQRA